MYKLIAVNISYFSFAELHEQKRVVFEHNDVERREVALLQQQQTQKSIRPNKLLDIVH